MRLFIAIELPATIKNALSAFQQDLRQAGAQINWSKPENLHLTLRFLGETDAQQVAALSQALAQTAIRFRAFVLETKTVGFFPNAQHPRVIWVGLKDTTNTLRSLHRALEHELSVAGFPPDNQNFHPHLTLGRFKSPQFAKALVSRATAYQFPALTFEVRQLVLMQSRLHPESSIYTPLYHAALGTNETFPA